MRAPEQRRRVTAAEWPWVAAAWRGVSRVWRMPVSMELVLELVRRRVVRSEMSPVVAALYRDVRPWESAAVAAVKVLGCDDCDAGGGADGFSERFVDCAIFLV